VVNGWISLRVKDPERVAAWYTDHKMLELFGTREEIGARALGSSEYGPALILIPGDQLDRPESLQLHLHVPDVDAEYERLKGEGVQFEEPPRNRPWGWRHAYTKDPAGHTVELCSTASRSAVQAVAMLRGELIADRSTAPGSPDSEVPAAESGRPTDAGSGASPRRRRRRRRTTLMGKSPLAEISRLGLPRRRREGRPYRSLLR
jgi:catechol 2,3-dioxygenase-like lactoylglutathione lyase family enzyme